MPYLPVPVWNGHEWEPKNFATADPIEWPDDFDPSTLPHPPYSLRSRVQFMFGTQKMEGEIQDIQLHGGTFTGNITDAIAERYRLEKATYTIYANGHGRWVRQKYILSQPNTTQN